MRFLFYIGFLAATFGLVQVSLGTNSRSNFNTSGENEFLDYLKHWEPPEGIRRNYTYYLSGFDYENRPIWVVEFGRWDLRYIIEKGGKDLEDFDTYFRQTLYRFINGPPGDVQPKGDRGEGSVFICDTEKFDLRQFTSLATIRYILTMMAGRLGKLIDHLAYANFLVETVLNAAKPFLGRTLERIENYGTNPAVWMPRLLRNIPRKSLPEWYGGFKNYTPTQVFG